MTDTACIFNIQKFSIHDGPGIRSVVFFKGCPLHCYWCSNPESQKGQPEEMWDNQKKQDVVVGEYKQVAEILAEVMKDQPFYQESGGGVTLSGGEVLYQADAAIELLNALKENDIHTACETTGYATVETFKRFIQQIDLLYFDIKHYDSRQHRKGTGVGNEKILANLALALEEQVDLIVRIPIIPNFNDSLVDAEAFAGLFTQLGVTSVELLPFHQFGEKKYENLHRSYDLHNIPQLHAEDLLLHKKIFENRNILCTIN